MDVRFEVRSNPYGTRETAATYLRAYAFSSHMMELLLAHKERSQVTASYQHHELETERRALQYWADQLDLLASTEKSQLAA